MPPRRGFCLLPLLPLLFLTAHVRAQDLPPLPNFEKRIDYVAWYEKAVHPGGKDDAFNLYAEFIPDMPASRVARDDWPKFEGMLSIAIFNGGEEEMRPGPWDPKIKPTWEASYMRTRAELKHFVAASKKKRFALASKLQPNVESAANLLQSLKLRHLPYLSECARGVLESAWRAEDGNLSSKALLAAFETNLRVAAQLRNGLFIDEQLTARDIRMVTYRSIRWAFAHKVLKDDELPHLAKTLATYDGRPIDFSPGLRGDAAKLLDAVQYMYGPLGGGEGRNSINGNRYREVTGQHLSGAGRLALGARLETDADGTVKAILDAFKLANSVLGPDWNQPSDHKMSGAFIQMENFNRVTQSLNYGQYRIGNVYTTNVACETQRRGTQLLVALFAHKAAKGKFPKKLSELDKKLVKKVGKDPFAGEPFRYRPTKKGFTLYSVAVDEQDDKGNFSAEGGELAHGNDLVIWPIPQSADQIAAVQLLLLKPADLTPISKIGVALEGKTVHVGAELTRVASRVSRSQGRVYILTVTQDDKSIDIIYYQDVADQLTPEQKFEVGQHIRASGVVVKNDEGRRIHVTDPRNLAIEPREKPARPEP